MPITSENNLLLRTHAGDSAAARELWALYGGRMVALAGALLGDRAGQAGHDVVQAVLLRVLKVDRSTLARVEDAGAWLLGAVRHEASNVRRGHRRRVTRENAAAPPESPAQPDRLQQQDALLDAIATLPEQHRELLVLKHVGGLTFEQLALCMHEHRSTVASRYRVALEALKGTLNQKSDSDREPARRHGDGTEALRPRAGGGVAHAS